VPSVAGEIYFKLKKEKNFHLKNIVFLAYVTTGIPMGSHEKCQLIWFAVCPAVANTKIYA